MKDLFLEVLKLSLWASLFAAAVAVLRLVFRKAPRWVFCALWAVVAVRLLVPVSIQTRLSLVPEEISRGQIAQQITDGYVGDVQIHYAGSPEYQAALDAGREPVVVPQGNYVVTEVDSTEEPVSVAEVLAWIWFGGLVLMLLLTAVSVLLLRRQVATATRLRDNIRQSERVDSPFVLGLLRPVIYLPYGMDPGDMEHVIAHERAHIRRGDHWWKPLGFLLLSIHWFNPVLWVAYVLLCRDIEAACDEKVIRAMNKEEIRSYSRALLHCSVHRRRVAACPLAFGEVGVKARIRSVMHYKKPAFWMVLAAVAVSAVAAVLLLTNPVEEHPAETTEPVQTTGQAVETTVPVTEPEETTEPVLTEEELEARFLELVDAVLADVTNKMADPFTYLDAKREIVEQLWNLGEPAVPVMVRYLENSPEDGPREWTVAAVCAEITGIGDRGTGQNWRAATQWLKLYYEATGDVPGAEQIGSSVPLNGGLFGVDCVYLRRDGVRADAYEKDVFYYTGTFLYYGDGKSWNTAGDVTELMTLEYELFKTGDFDADGTVELFAAGEYNVYRLFDWEKGQLQETRLSVVPDNILDYGLLLDSGLYLYQEKWVRFMAEPEEYIRQMAARGKENFYSMRPTGVLPKVITDSQFREAYTAMHRLLDGTQTEDTRWMIYRMLLELECNCDAETAVNLSQPLNSAFPYERLLEKWSLTVEGMGEETNCFEQFLLLLQREPLALLRSMAAAPWQEYSRGYDGIVRWTATEAYHFNKEAFAGMVEYMETGAATEEEKTLARMFREVYTQLDVPWNVDTLVNGDGEVLWKALLEDTEGVIRLMGSLSADQVRKAANSLFGMKMPSEQNQAKCYRALLAMPFESLSETEEFFACRLMMEMELFGGQDQYYTPGKAFDFYKLFTKTKYSDGAYSELCASQLQGVFTQVPEEFLKELAAWGEDPTRVISQLKYAYGYQEDGQEQLRQVLTGVLEKTKNEAVKALIESILEN